MQEPRQRGLGTVALTALVVGAMLGSGIFSLPQNMAEGAGAGAIVIAWGITAIGMLALTRIFQWFALNRPDLADGVYGYARAGYGDYLGFNAAWGYWISVWVGCVGYLVVMFSALGSFADLSLFGDGSSRAALAGGLITLWSVHALVLRGVQSAALLNTLVTVAKLVPLALFILCVALAFRAPVFGQDFWGRPQLGSVVAQVRTTMLYTVWVFLGIECATVYAGRARDMATVSRATLLGFLITTVLLVCVSLLSLGVVPQPELAAFKNPSMAGVIARAVGPWGALLVNGGLILSVAGALLAWILIASEMLYLAARGSNHTAPAAFGRLNRRGMPANALWLTNGLISLFLILNHLNGAGYNLLIQLASAMCLIPYLLCASFALRLALRSPTRSGWQIGLTLLGTVYAAWLIYAGGLTFLLDSMILYAVGLLFHARARRQRGLPLFSHPADRYCAAAVVLGAVVAVVRLSTGVGGWG